jgi:hypothetical protein
VLEQEAAGVGPGAFSPLWTDANAPLARSAAATRVDASARATAAASSPGAPPSMPMTSRREVAPLLSWSSSTACSGVGAEGRNADRSAT